MDGALAFFRDEGLPHNTDEITDIDKIIEQRVGIVAHIALAQVALNASGDVADVKEAGLAHHTAGEHTTRHAHVQSFDEVCLQSPRIVTDLKLATKGCDATFLKLVELGTAELQEFGFGGFGGGLHDQAKSGAESLASCSAFATANRESSS